MPLNISDIIVSYEEIEYDPENTETEICSLCKQKLELSRANDWKPQPHTLDICLGFLFNKVLGETK